MISYHLTKDADADLDDIGRYLAKHSVTAPLRVADALYETFAFLAEHPHAGTMRDDLMPDLRVYSAKKPANKYLVFFKPLPSGVEILAVIHGARDFPAILSERRLT